MSVDNTVNRGSFFDYSAKLDYTAETIIYQGANKTDAETALANLLREVLECSSIQCSIPGTSESDEYKITIKEDSSKSLLYISTSFNSGYIESIENTGYIFHKLKYQERNSYGQGAADSFKTPTRMYFYNYGTKFLEVTGKTDNTQSYRFAEENALPASHGIIDGMTQMIDDSNHSNITVPKTSQSILNESIFGQRFAYPGYAIRTHKIEGFLPKLTKGSKNEWGTGYNFGMNYFLSAGNFYDRTAVTPKKVHNIVINDETRFAAYPAPTILFGESKDLDIEVEEVEVKTIDDNSYFVFKLYDRDKKSGESGPTYRVDYDPDVDKIVKYQYDPSVSVLPTPAVAPGTCNLVYADKKDAFLFFGGGDGYGEVMGVAMLYPANARGDVTFNNTNAGTIKEYGNGGTKGRDVADEDTLQMYKSVIRNSTTGANGKYPALHHLSIPRVRSGNPKDGIGSKVTTNGAFATEYMNFYNGWFNNHYMAGEMAVLNAKEFVVNFIGRQYVGYHDYQYYATPSYTTSLPYSQVINPVGRETGYKGTFECTMSLSLGIYASGTMYLTLDGVDVPEWQSRLNDDTQKKEARGEYYASADDTHKANHNYCNYLAGHADNLNNGNNAEESELEGKITLSLGTFAGRRKFISYVMWSPRKITVERKIDSKTWKALTEKEIYELS